MLVVVLVCAVRWGCPHPYWPWPGVQGGSSCLCVPAVSTHTSQGMPAQPPQLLLWCLVPLVPRIPYVILSHTAFPDARKWIVIFFFFKFTGTKNNFFWAGFTVSVGASSKHRYVVEVPWNRTCMAGHLVLHMCAKVPAEECPSEAAPQTLQPSFTLTVAIVAALPQPSYSLFVSRHPPPPPPRCPLTPWSPAWWRKPRTKVGGSRVTGSAAQKGVLTALCGSSRKNLTCKN